MSADEGSERAVAGSLASPGRARALALALAPVDRMLLAALAGLATVFAAAHPHPLPLVACVAVLAAAVVGAAAWEARDPAARVVHAWTPLPVVILVYTLCGPALEWATRARWDGVLAALDVRLFGALVAGWRGALGRPAWLTDVASVAYFSYYFVPVLLGIALYARGRRPEYDRFVFAIVATLLVSYCAYFVAPATGPRVPRALEARVLGGGAVSAAVRLFVRSAEGNKLDAFPSAHTALSLVFGTLGWRLFPRWRVRLPLAAVVAAIIFSTVYLSWHYVVDLAAGAALAAAMIALLPLLRWIFGAPRAVPSP